MAIFTLTALSGPVMIVRARCLSCAREVAVRNAGAEGTLTWRDPSLSTCALAPKSHHNPEGKPALLERMEAPQ